MDFKYWDAKQSRKIVDCKLIVTTVDPEMLMKKLTLPKDSTLKSAFWLRSLVVFYKVTLIITKICWRFDKCQAQFSDIASINSFNTHNNTMKYVLLLYFEIRNWSTEGLSNLPNIIQPGSHASSLVLQPVHLPLCKMAFQGIEAILKTVAK